MLLGLMFLQRQAMFAVRTPSGSAGVMTSWLQIQCLQASETQHAYFVDTCSSFSCIRCGFQMDLGMASAAGIVGEAQSLTIVT